MTQSSQQAESQSGVCMTAILDKDRLRVTKEGIAAGNAGFKPALEALLREARQWCDRQPPTVMDKTRIASGGDRHDYLSLGPYWWPDPLREDGLPYIRRDGKINPEAMAAGTDRCSLEAMSAGAETLALAWYFTGEEKYARYAMKYISAWFLDPSTRMNPHLEYGQAIPGICEGRGIGLIETRRFSLVINAMELLENSSEVARIQQEDLRDWFRTFLQWMRESPHGREESKEHNNHGTWYDVQTAHFALFTGERELAFAILESAAKNRLPAQIAADGSQPHELARTRSFTYSLLNLGGFLALAELGKSVGLDFWTIPAPDGESMLLKAINYLAPYADSDMPWPHEQITPLHRIDIFPFLRQATYYTGDARYEGTCRKLPLRDLLAHRTNLFWPL